MSAPATMRVTTGEREIVATRVFDAPQALVFDCLTKPELLKRWFGSHGWDLAVCEVDLRPGGAFRYVWSNGKGKEMGMGGMFIDIVPPERIVATAKFDEAWYPGKETTTTTLVERDGKTTMTVTVMYDSKEALEAVMKTPATTGMAQGYDRMAELLAVLQ